MITINEIEGIEWDLKGNYLECVTRNGDNLELIKTFVLNPDNSHEDKIRAARKIDSFLPTLARKCGITSEPKAITGEELLEIVIEGLTIATAINPNSGRNYG